MKRPDYLVTVTLDGADQPMHTETRHAMNAGIRASEGLVREMARAAGTVYFGGPVWRVGDTYTRTWTPRDTMLSNVHATVKRVT